MFAFIRYTVGSNEGLIVRALCNIRIGNLSGNDIAQPEDSDPFQLGPLIDNIMGNDKQEVPANILGSKERVLKKANFGEGTQECNSGSVGSGPAIPPGYTPTTLETMQSEQDGDGVLPRTPVHGDGCRTSDVSPVTKKCDSEVK
ncbi:hypothetical protein L2E82_28259 [Cichorium intybus]|uniref:Uncharacterized protein n=1 Tax=Cichorium intybus TaxID=13427 RepID=A0ACB9CVL6_CICIN|nr:hypothetical protein L2E82_28259 [Cichorium intybus]